MALAEATKEGIWMKALIGFPQEKTIIFCDILSASCLAKDQVHYERTKHIGIRYHFICSEKRVIIKKVDTRENPTDMFMNLLQEVISYIVWIYIT